MKGFDVYDDVTSDRITIELLLRRTLHRTEQFPTKALIQAEPHRHGNAA
jgi:hypothetical protein